MRGGVEEEHTEQVSSFSITEEVMFGYPCKLDAGGLMLQK